MFEQTSVVIEPPDNNGVIVARVRETAEHTAERFAKALAHAAAQQKQIKGLVLSFDDNGGGTVAGAARLASMLTGKQHRSCNNSAQTSKDFHPQEFASSTRRVSSQTKLTTRATLPSRHNQPQAKCSPTCAQA